MTVSSAGINSVPTLDGIIPKPAVATATGGSFAPAAGAAVYVRPDTAEIRAIAESIAEMLSPAAGVRLPIQPAPDLPAKGGILLSAAGGDSALGEEGYDLTIAPDAITLSASGPEGLFRGAQTLRQLVPPTLENPAAPRRPWRIPAGTIRDYPRFAWRGVMLDVARHFFSVADLKRYIDLLALYKINRLHLHLTDDQGWRLMIASWPRLAEYGGSTQAGGGPGGYYTQQDYAEIVAYAQSRYITIVPEIDMPGHTNAALASYPELNRNGQAPDLYTGTKVGFSSLCTEKEITYKFADDVLREVAALTPGPYLHIGGDEVPALSKEEYANFIGRVQRIVAAYGKRTLGWEEIAQAELAPDTAVQHWNIDPALSGLAAKAARLGAKVIMSPASRAYLDMKYDAKTPFGSRWAGYLEARKAYDWDPAREIAGLAEGGLLGLEAPLWTETLSTLKDVEFMTLPRLPGYAEIGWSPAAGRNWNEYKVRLAAQEERWTAMGVSFHRSPQVPWESAGK